MKNNQRERIETLERVVACLGEMQKAWHAPGAAPGKSDDFREGGQHMVAELIIIFERIREKELEHADGN